MEGLNIVAIYKVDIIDYGVLTVDAESESLALEEAKKLSGLENIQGDIEIQD
jgi:hypothetical protein